MNNLKLLFGKGNSIGQYGMIIALIVLLAFFAFTTNGLILEPTNVINLFLQYSYILILALGMVMVIIAGHIDLSVGSVAAVVGIVVAQSMAVWDFPVWAAIILGLACGALIGAWQASGSRS
jgi:putative multiple sugar transport system permease protein